MTLKSFLNWLLWTSGLALIHVTYVHLVTGLNIGLPIFSEDNLEYVAWLRSVPFPTATLTVLGHAFREELVFRFLYLAFFCLREDFTEIGIAVLISSVIFGVVHGGFANIILQGVGGLLLCLQFLYFGGVDKNFTKALASTTTTHTLINLILVFLW